MLGDEAPSDGDVAREAARLRKRFQSLKDDLKLRAKDAGLILWSKGDGPPLRHRFRGGLVDLWSKTGKSQKSRPRAGGKIP